MWTKSDKVNNGWIKISYELTDQEWERLQELLGKQNIDSTQHIGKSKGGKTTKIHALVDALGYPVRILLSAGNVNDITIAPKIIENLEV